MAKTIITDIIYNDGGGRGGGVGICAEKKKGIFFCQAIARYSLVLAYITPDTYEQE